MASTDPPVETKQEARRHPRSRTAVYDSEEWLFTTMESIGDAVIATDADGRIEFMNKVAVAMTGWSEEEAQHRDCREVFQIVNETTRETTESPVSKVLRDGVISGLANHTILISKDGTERCIGDSGSPIHNKDGVLVGVVLIFRDVTDHRNAEIALAERTAILQNLFDHIPVMVAFLDEKAQFKWVNQQWVSVTGWTLEAMQGREMMTEFYPDPARRRSAADHLAFASPGWRDFQTTIHDGSILDISWASVRLTDGTSIGIGQVVTERKRVEAAADRSHAVTEARNTRLELAMRETTHRAKNNLQMVAALVELQASGDGETVPLEQLNLLKLHVQSLGQIQELLLEDSRRNSFASDISATSALGRLIPLLQRTVGASRIEFNADEVRLPVKQGMSLAVLVNELISNAVKHGGKQIGLRLQVTGEAISLEVTDDGPGFPMPFHPKPGTSGLELVESLSRLDLDGTVTFNNRPEGGGLVRITFPAPVAMQA